MKQVYSYQEIGTRIDQGRQVVFTCYPEARVSAIQKHHNSDTVTVTINLCIRETCIGIVSYEYASMFAVLDAFDRDDLDEVKERLTVFEKVFKRTHFLSKQAEKGRENAHLRNRESATNRGSMQDARFSSQDTFGHLTWREMFTRS